MKLGIDFGSTRIVVAAVDRGNYPVVFFEDAEGASREWFPPLIAAREDRRLYGWQAWDVQTDPEWTVVRSLKRTLQEAGPHTEIEIAGQSFPLLQILRELVGALKNALVETSSMPATDALEVMLGVPANSNSNQRYLTVEPFQRAGFSVLGLLNEPSAASIEYGHRSRGAAPEQVLVYDLGGGTFDASLVRIEDRNHEIIASEGVPDLGGDDFDIILSDMALAAAGIASDELTQAELFRLHEECRAKKEALHPNTRRIVVDLSGVREGWTEIAVPAAEFYECCRPLVVKTVEATERLLEEHDAGKRLDSLYVTGGGSELPLVARMLKEVFGRRVKRSAYTRSATAIGLAIQADTQAGYVLRESFGRHFGVWRESDAGQVVVFDPLFAKGMALPGPGEPAITISRSYTPVHNIGHFRFLECSRTSEDGRPTGDITVWDEVLFPFDPEVEGADLAGRPVQHTEAARRQTVEESYTINGTGTVAVTISNLTAGYSRTYKLGRWAAKGDPVVPGRKKRVKAEARG
jgi:molecular chaperone DnaK (HSP70)